MVSGLFPRLRRKSPVTNAASTGAESASTSAPAADPLQGVRPKLLLDSIFLPTEKGVYFRSRQGHFTLDGRDTYALVSDLVPRLTGKQTVDDLCEGLEAEKRDPARKLISTLLEKRILINHVEETTDLSPSVLQRFAPQIQFIEHFVDAPVARFARFRKSRILLTGSGIPLHMLALSLARNGIETVLLDANTPPIERDDEFSALIQDYKSGNIPLAFERVSLANVLTQKPGSLDALCYVSDVADLKQIAAINKYACAQQIHFLPGLLLGGKSFVGPLVRSGEPGCWMCALLRDSANLKPELEALVWRHYALDLPWANDGQPASSPSLRILGNSLGFELFKLFVKHIPTETNSAVLSLDLETLETGTSRLLPHPSCPHCLKDEPEGDRIFLSQARTDTGRENSDVGQKLNLMSPLIDRDFGIIRRFDDDDLEQLPIFQSCVALARSPDGQEMTFPGYSIQSNAAARVDALLNAVRCYAASIPSWRRSWTGTRNEALRAGFNPLPNAVLSNWMGGPSTSGENASQWMHVRSLGAGTMHLVDAGAVYSQTYMNPGYYEKAEAGVGVGFSFRQACGDAILSLFAHEILKRAAIRDIAFSELDIDYLAEANANVKYWRNILGHMDRSFRVAAFTHEGSGSVVAAFFPEDAGSPDRIAVGAAALLQPAVVAALTDLVALGIGRPSVRTAERRLPLSLGYILDFAAPEDGLPPKVKLPLASNDQNMNSVLYAFGGRFTDIVIANVAGEDLRRCGLFALRALFVRSATAD
jgi:bacteriocin biosynthesis cyclodehydratase domain-containing protein